MKNFNSNQTFSRYDYFLGQALSKKKKDVAVVLSSKRYKELKRLEDILYGKAAQLAIKEGLAPKNEVEDVLANIK